MAEEVEMSVAHAVVHDETDKKIWPMAVRVFEKNTGLAVQCHLEKDKKPRVFLTVPKSGMTDALEALTHTVIAAAGITQHFRVELREDDLDLLWQARRQEENLVSGYLKAADWPTFRKQLQEKYKL